MIYCIRLLSFASLIFVSSAFTTALARNGNAATNGVRPGHLKISAKIKIVDSQAQKPMKKAKVKVKWKCNRRCAGTFQGNTNRRGTLHFEKSVKCIPGCKRPLLEATITASQSGYKPQTTFLEIPTNPRPPFRTYQYEPSIDTKIWLYPGRGNNKRRAY